MPEEHVLVGGLGFLGVNLAKLLAERGEKVVVLARKGGYTRRRHLAKILEDLGVRVRVVERVEPGDVEGAGVVYHLAGKPGGSLEVNMESHVNLLKREIEGASRSGSRLVYVSSIGVVADAAPKPPGSTVEEEEEHLWGVPEERFRSVFRSVHSYTKALGEKLLVGSGKSLDGKWAILRPALVFGPYSYHPEWKMIRLLAKLRLAPSSRRVPVVNVLDVAEILARAGGGQYDSSWVNVVAENYTLTHVVEAICKGLDRSFCLKIPVDPLILSGRLAPWTSPSRLAWSIVRRRYKYRSRLLAGYSWRLEPVI